MNFTSRLKENWSQSITFSVVFVVLVLFPRSLKAQNAGMEDFASVGNQDISMGSFGGDFISPSKPKPIVEAKKPLLLAAPSKTVAPVTNTHVKENAVDEDTQKMVAFQRTLRAKIVLPSIRFLQGVRAKAEASSHKKAKHAPPVYWHPTTNMYWNTRTKG